MTYSMITRRTSVMTALGEAARRVRARFNLTPRERHNLHVTQTPLAVVTASLGSHTYRR